MRRPIRALPPDLALKIAAGEVVERPASAVKELLDNAIDAGATDIKIEIREAGLKLIRMSDDGCGIPRDEIALAFTSHATNKIADLDDLEHLRTLGFRGEALPSIAAVSRVVLHTRAETEPVGTRFEIEHGQERSRQAASSPRGTRIEIFDLFANVPARRKFVRSQRAEAGQIQRVVMQYTLAQPAIRFTLRVDDRVTFTGPGTGSLTDAVAAVHGTTALPSLWPVSAEEAGIQIDGVISKPALTRANRSAVDIFVNGRPVANRSLVFALEEAYSGYLMVGRHPLAAIHLTVPPGDVDVNIHPSKSEVRFAREREVHGILHRAVATALLELRLQARGLDGAITETPPDTTTLVSQDSLLPAGAPPDQADSLLPAVPALRVFGQTNATFIIAEGPQGIYMIDQHAAHERILFDRFEEQLDGGDAVSQALLEPASLDLTPEQTLSLDENRELLEGVGFLLEPFGDHACLIRAVPTLAGRIGPIEIVDEVLNELHDLPEPAAARERALAAMACKAAVKAGQMLDVREMREIVMQLERTRRPSTCPHGRPTMVHLSHTQLEREFGRR